MIYSYDVLFATPHIETYTENLITTTGTLFGSRATGGASATSDYDYVIPYDIMHNILNSGVKYNNVDTSYECLHASAHIKLYLNDRKYDVLAFSNPKRHQFIVSFLTVANTIIVRRGYSTRELRVTGFSSVLSALEGKGVSREIRPFLEDEFPELLL